MEVPSARIRRMWTVVMMAISICATCTAGHAGERVALVVGNSDYTQAGVLANTLSDAQKVADRLRGLNFDVIYVANADLASFRRAIGELERRGSGARLGLFYYAGHGIALDGANYLVPVDFDPAGSSVEKRLIPIEEVIRVLRRDGKQVLVLLDACRDNPFVDRLRRRGVTSVQRGLANMDRLSNGDGKALAPMESGEIDIDVYVGFATQPGNVAYDGPAGQNSPFSQALVEHLVERLEIREVMTRVRASVIKTTNGQQVPWDQSSLTMPVFLSGKPPPERDKAPVRTMPPP